MKVLISFIYKFTFQDVLSFSKENNLDFKSNPTISEISAFILNYMQDLWAGEDYEYITRKEVNCRQPVDSNQICSVENSFNVTVEWSFPTTIEDEEKAIEVVVNEYRYIGNDNYLADNGWHRLET